MIESPCNKICLIDEDDVCIGCHRTLREIAAWSGASDAEKAAILSAIKTRHPGESRDPDDRPTGSRLPPG